MRGQGGHRDEAELKSATQWCGLVWAALMLAAAANATGCNFPKSATPVAGMPAPLPSPAPSASPVAGACSPTGQHSQTSYTSSLHMNGGLLAQPYTPASAFQLSKVHVGFTVSLPSNDGGCSTITMNVYRDNGGATPVSGTLLGSAAGVGPDGTTINTSGTPHPLTFDLSQAAISLVAGQKYWLEIAVNSCSLGAIQVDYGSVNAGTGGLKDSFGTWQNTSSATGDADDSLIFDVTGC